MPTNAELSERAKAHLYPNYRPAPIVFVRGSGSTLHDADGRSYLDMAAGVAVNSLGHAHPALTRAISEQATKLLHVSNYFFNAENVFLAEELTALAGYPRAFFCNSGAEAIEAVLKLARHHFHGRGEREKSTILAFDNAFHGRTMGALSLTGTPKYREGFGGLSGVVHLPFGDLARVEAAMDRHVAAILVEPVQGEGGVLPAPPGFLTGLRALCDRTGALLLIDEVQSGVFRTGPFLAHTRAGVRADAVALAKGLGGGFPIGAMLTTEELAGALPPGTHGSTFGGNALASAAARAVLKIGVEEKLGDNAEMRGAQLLAGLQAIVREFNGVCEGARGEGLLVGLVLRKGFIVRDLLPSLQTAGLLVTAAGERVIRFTPPLVVTAAEIDEALAIVRGVVATLPSPST